ncbi:ATP-grasp domain-containing protein [Sediminibacterium sp.]|uniref:ATP-grasp domain-containing protein n=1 Tax=Sediminibacterium sp. TaxID=1917865 RepID=UPI003F71BB8C
MNTKSKSILLIGYDSNIALGVLACLRKEGYYFYLLSHNHKNAAKCSRYIKKTFYYNAENDSLKDKIISIVKQYNIDFIMPYDELEIREVKIHQNELAKYAPSVLATETEFFDIGIHKLNLAKFLTERNIPCPPFATLNNLEEQERLINQVGFPLLLKPVRMASGRMIQKVYDQQSLNNIIEANRDNLSNFLLQPFIIGNDVTCNVICKNGEIICYTIQESPVKTGSNFSSNDTLCYHQDKAVISIVSSMMKALEWNGVACIDMRRNATTKEVYILEINGRFWASVLPSFVKAGVNFPLVLLKLSLGEKFEIPKLKSAIQVSFKEYIHSLLTFGKLKFSDTKYKSYLLDPIARFMQMASALF